MNNDIKRTKKDRRVFSYTKYLPERRSGKGRRSVQKDYDSEERMAS